MSTNVKDPVRLGSDPPPEGSQSADNYEAPTKVGESAYAILARALVDETGAEQPAATNTATTAPPPPPAAGSAPPAAAEAEALEEAPVPSRAPARPAVAPENRIEIVIALASFLAVAIPAVLYVIYLR